MCRGQGSGLHALEKAGAFYYAGTINAQSQWLSKISILSFVRLQSLTSFRLQTNHHLRRCQLSAMWRTELRQARYGANLRGQPAPQNPSSHLISTTIVHLFGSLWRRSLLQFFSPGHTMVALTALLSRRCRHQFSVSNSTEVISCCTQPRISCGLQHLRDIECKSKMVGVAGLGSRTAACTIA